MPQRADGRRAALQRAQSRLPQANVHGVSWHRGAGDNPRSERHAVADELRPLAPFDPVVWDRRRFELFWGRVFRFEADTPTAQPVRGHYALPLLWRGQVIGWGNAALRDGALHTIRASSPAGRRAVPTSSAPGMPGAPGCRPFWAWWLTRQ